MGFLSRLFGRVQEEPVAPPPPPPLRPEPEPESEPEPVPALEPEPEPVGAGHVPPAVDPELELEPEPEPEPEAGPPAELSLTLAEATAALRAAGSDGIRIGFLSRDYLRAAEEDRNASRRRLVTVLAEQLRSRGLLADDGRFELREESHAPRG